MSKALAKSVLATELRDVSNKPQMRYRWGIAAARAFARHRVRRVCYIGAARRPRAAQIVGRPEGEWGMATAVAFQAAQGWRWGGQGPGWWAGGRRLVSGGRRVVAGRVGLFDGVLFLGCRLLCV